MNQRSGQGWGFRKQGAILFIMAAVTMLLLASASVTVAQQCEGGENRCGPFGSTSCVSPFVCDEDRDSPTCGECVLQCDPACGPDEVCNRDTGECVSACMPACDPQTETCRGGQCVALPCGPERPCGPDQECENGECVALPCPVPCDPQTETCINLVCERLCTSDEECRAAGRGEVCAGICQDQPSQIFDANNVSELIARIEEANRTLADDTIVLRTGAYALMNMHNEVDGPNGLPSITSPITITIPAGASRATIQRDVTAPEFRIFHVAAAGRLVLDGVIITNGASGSGGGIRNLGSLTLRNSTIRNNTSSFEGGGLVNFGTAELLDSEVSNNTTGVGVGGGNGFGGGISNLGATARLTLTGSTVHGNEAIINAGGIENYFGGTLMLRSSTVRGNLAGFGGGILSQGTATLTESTVSGNVSRFGGGGLENFLGGTFALRNSTVSNNTGDIVGGIISGGTLTLNNVTITENRLSQNAAAEAVAGIVNSGAATVSNTIIAENMDDRDCAGTFTSQGFNLIGNGQDCRGFEARGDHVGTPAQPIDAGLGPLALHGGPTETHLLLPGSDTPAIDGGNPAPVGGADGTCERVDQRGVTRPQDGDEDGTAICDIGAVEIGPGGG